MKHYRQEMILSILDLVGSDAKENQDKQTIVQHLKSIDDGIQRIIGLLEQLLESERYPLPPDCEIL